MMDKKKVREAIYCMKSFADDTVCEECDNYDRCDHTMVADNAKIAIEALERESEKMKNYDPNIYRGVHTVKITLQMWEYKGHIIRRVGGICKGRDILDFDFGYEDVFPNNDCQLEYHEDLDFFSCVLKDENGNTLKCEANAEEMNDMIVGIEIIDFCKE